jgi:hypothetical protein
MYHKIIVISNVIIAVRSQTLGNKKPLETAKIVAEFGQIWPKWPNVFTLKV